MQCKIPLEHLPFELQNYLTTHRVRCVDQMNYSSIPCITPPFPPSLTLYALISHPLSHILTPSPPPSPLPSPSSPPLFPLTSPPPSLASLPLSYHSLVSDTHTHTHTHILSHAHTHRHSVWSHPYPSSTQDPSHPPQDFYELHLPLDRVFFVEDLQELQQCRETLTRVMIASFSGHSPSQRRNLTLTVCACVYRDITFSKTKKKQRELTCTPKLCLGKLCIKLPALCYASNSWKCKYCASRGSCIVLTLCSIM